jgi:hypothetical protein
MLHGNLATRPFYNERLVTLALALVAVVGIGVSVFNARQVMDLSSQHSKLTDKIESNQKSAAAIRADAQATERTVDHKHLVALVDATREANNLIDQRTFSWTTLLGLIEKTLPIDVRLVAISPKIEKDTTLITMIVVSRRDGALEDFVSALEGTPGMGTFYDVIKRADQRNEDGTYGATIAAYYLPPQASTAEPSAAGSPAAPTTSTTAPAAPAPSGKGGRQ